MGLAAYDAELRAAAFAHIEAAKRRHGDILPWSVFNQDFYFRGEQVKLASQRGIHKPKQLREAALTISTAPPKPGRPAPYDDAFDLQGHLIYAYQGDDPDHYDNRQLRAACVRQLPVIYLFGVAKGRYHVEAPVYVVADDPDNRRFVVDIGQPAGSFFDDRIAEPVRAYVEHPAKRRLHQAAFRHAVLDAYQERCTICRLNRVELLEAAHITPDRDPGGAPIVRNGLSLCQIHHGAFNRLLIGIRPDLIVEVRKDLLLERDGPMLEQLKASHGHRLEVIPRRPANQPDPDRLEERYELFRKSA